MLRYCNLYYTVSDSSTLCFPWKSIVSDAFHLLSTCARTIENVHRCQRKHCPGWKNLKTEPYRLRWTAETEPLRKIMPFALYAHAQMMVVVFPFADIYVFGCFSAEGENAAKTINKTVLKTRLFHSIVSKTQSTEKARTFCLPFFGFESLRSMIGLKN